MRLFASRVYGRWEPHLTVDTHATNGSVHRYALTYDTPHTVESGRPEPIAYMRERFLPEVRERLRRRTGLETFFYGNFVDDEGGEGEGWMTYTHHPRFGSHYRGLTNRLDILAETYSYLPFEERVRTSYGFVEEVLHLAAERGDEMVDVVARSRMPSGRVAVRYAPRGLSRSRRHPHLRTAPAGRSARHRAHSAPRALPRDRRRRPPVGLRGARSRRAKAGGARPAGDAPRSGPRGSCRGRAGRRLRADPFAEDPGGDVAGREGAPGGVPLREQDAARGHGDRRDRAAARAPSRSICAKRAATTARWRAAGSPSRLPVRSSRSFGSSSRSERARRSSRVLRP